MITNVYTLTIQSHKEVMPLEIILPDDCLRSSLPSTIEMPAFFTAVGSGNRLAASRGQAASRDWDS